MNEYLKVLLEQIRCKKAHPYIRQELQDHIEDQIEENVQAGMSYEYAEKEAVRDMGDPIETGISLDRIHRPQVAWKLLFLVILLSIAGILIHAVISSRVVGADASASGRYALHVMLGLALMIILYFLDYTLLARFSKIIAVALIGICVITLLFGNTVNGMRVFLVFAGNSISVQALMLFYVPIYGGIIYKYRGFGYQGLLRSIAWMVLPVFLVLRLPAIMTAGPMLISMLVMLTIAVWKDWFRVAKRKTIGVLWGTFLGFPIIMIFIMYWGNVFASYQKERIQTFLPNSGTESYLTESVRALLSSNKIVGSNGLDVAENLPGFNTDYILTCLSSMYGMIAAIIVCCVLAVLIFIVFHTAIKQKNQLGMMMGCGCGMVFLISTLINVMENIGAFPPTVTFLPFISAGGSYVIMSYGLMGIVLSIYRYKNVYPRHVKINMLND